VSIVKEESEQSRPELWWHTARSHARISSPSPMQIGPVEGEWSP
jgi:hypothetical protein